MKNKISVITASYGHDKYIAAAIESVLAQTFTEFEYIIFDDGSKDSSRDIIEEYAKRDSRIKFHTHENIANKGLAKTVEASIALANSPYIAFLESDDMWESTFLEEMYQVAEKREDVGLFYSDVKPFGSDEINNTKHEKLLSRRRRFIHKESKNRMDLVFEGFISTFSSVFTRSHILKSFKYEPIIPQRLDHYLWTQCLLQMPACFVEKKLCRWRKHNESYSRSTVEPYPFACEDMLFDLLYPEHTEKDKVFYHSLVSGKKEKIFRKQIRAFLGYYFNKKYPHEKLKIYTY